MAESKNCSNFWNLLLGSVSILIGMGLIVSSIACYLGIEIQFEDNIHWGGGILILAALTIFTGVCMIAATIKKVRAVFVFTEIQLLVMTILYMAIGLLLLYMKNNFPEVKAKVSDTFVVVERDLYYVDKMAFTSFGIGSVFSAAIISNFFNAHKHWNFHLGFDRIDSRRVDEKSNRKSVDASRKSVDVSEVKACD